MIKFEIYYKKHFQKDLLNFVSQIPVQGNAHYKNDEVNIQYFYLIPYYKYLDILPDENKSHFVVSLFWTVLVDQVYYSHFRSCYGSFKYKTMYPKFIGNCTAPSSMSSECGHHLHPSRIFDAVNDYVNKGNKEGFFREVFQKDESPLKRAKIDCNESLIESKKVMMQEIKDYFLNHTPEVFWKDFWDKCLLELNYQNV